MFYLSDSEGNVVASSDKREGFDLTVLKNGGTVTEVKGGGDRQDRQVIVNGSLQIRDKTPFERRVERRNKFPQTIDRMNSLWLASLSGDQSLRLRDLRQEWLDYPSTGVEPQTDVSDIFQET